MADAPAPAAEPAATDAPAPAAVLVLARAPRPGTVRRALEARLGAEGCAALQAALIQRVATWAAEVAPGAVHVAYTPDDAEAEFRRLLGPDVHLLAQSVGGITDRLARAVAAVLAQDERPLLIVWPELARWRPEHATGALGDLRCGCEVVVGPKFEGGFYLIALARPVPALFALPDETWSGPDAMAAVIGAAQQSGLEIGILRAERGLNRPEDARAALADPLLDGELAAMLRARPQSTAGGRAGPGHRALS